MELLEWIQVNRPGRFEHLADRIEIFHDSGERSTIWIRNEASPVVGLERLGTIYGKYDGLDLFSSTFKIASTHQPRSRNSVLLVQNLDELAEGVRLLGACFPEDAIAFMYQAGIGFYALGLTSGMIYEWDSEQGELSGEYNSVYEVLDEWLAAVS